MTISNSNWHQDVRFGMFIHFGLYANLAGYWRGEKIPRLGEQIMRFAEISAEDYQQIAEEFNPKKFSAKEWVTLAKEAGMKYLVITAKHHDGFALFNSKYSDFNIMNTPFGRDLVAELAAECKTQNIKFCVYYSHRQDWHEEDGVWSEWEGQFKTPYAQRDVDFNRYMNSKGLPQVGELLTNYGDIGLIWYDTPTDATLEQSQSFYDYAHKIQSDVLVCDRVGNGLGDYKVLGDNEFPYIAKDVNGEVPATINHTWGFKSYDKEWKSTKDLLYSLIKSAANGCNYLLNIGPDADGIVPEESVTRLHEIGEWLAVNGEAIYGSKSVPFIVPLVDLFATQKDNSIFLIYDEKAGNSIVIEDILSDVETCEILMANKNTIVDFEQDNGIIKIKDIPKTQLFATIKLTFREKPVINNILHQQLNGNVTLLTGVADIVDAGKLTINELGLPEHLEVGEGALVWHFRAPKGRYNIEILTNRHWSKSWNDGITAKLICDGYSISKQLEQNCELDNIQKSYHPESISKFGEITLADDGEHTLSFSIIEIDNLLNANTLTEDIKNDMAINLLEIRLILDL